MDRIAYSPTQIQYRPSRTKAIYFGADDKKEVPEPPKDKGIFLTPEEMKRKRTPEQKKGWLCLGFNH